MTNIGPARRSRDDELEQGALFDFEPDWHSHWWGMPAFELRDARPAQQITVNFWSFDDVREFAARLGVNVTPRTDSLWFPREELGRPNEWVYRYEP